MDKPITTDVIKKYKKDIARELNRSKREMDAQKMTTDEYITSALFNKHIAKLAKIQTKLHKKLYGETKCV